MMAGPESIDQRIFPPLQVDGKMDVLTGLDAPEIFYKFLEQSIARSSRNQKESVALVRFRFITDRPRIDSFGKQTMDFEVAALADFLKKRTRSDERLVRIGEATFLILAQVDDHQGIEGMKARFSRSLADFIEIYGGNVVPVENVDHSPKSAFELELSTFTHQKGEPMLDFLERAGV